MEAGSRVTPIDLPASPSTSGRPDILDEKDVTLLLRDFYGRAFADDLLGPIFLAQMDLEAHLPILCDFWMTVLFRAGRYRRNAMLPHKAVHQVDPLSAKHFEQWLRLWQHTVDDRHTGPTADFAKLQGTRMADSMCRTVTREFSEPIRAQLLRMTKSPST